jgi:hypothetical protein
MKSPKQCPICKCRRQKDSGGWAVDFNCGTRFGNMSESIVWRGRKCLEKEKGRSLTPEELKEAKDAFYKAFYGV